MGFGCNHRKNVISVEVGPLPFLGFSRSHGESSILLEVGPWAVYAMLCVAELCMISNMDSKKLFLLYNSLSRKKEVFLPINPPKVRMYTCGPTIYDYPHIGNWRTYLLSDILVRTIRFLGYSVKHAMNLTDVGHLSGDNLGDSSQGEDRMVKASKKEGVDAWAIADKYGKDFVDSFNDFNIIRPEVIPKATSHIKEQIALIKQIEEKGLTYKTDDGIYFDVREYERRGNKYGELSNLDQREEGIRIKPNPEKKDKRDFALWKFFATGQKRYEMEWKSPWGVGYPGWHVECSAMSTKYLGNQFDVHVGGEDLRSTHHPNEIVQSECATGEKPVVKYWVHVAFLLVDGGKMGKSLGNAYSLHDIKRRGFDPIAFRFLTLGTHYRKQMNFTWNDLESAQRALHKLRRVAQVYPRTNLSHRGPTSTIKDQPQYVEFLHAICNDLNMAKALAVAWKVLEDDSLNDKMKGLLLSEFDEVLGLDIFANGIWSDKEPTVQLENLPDDVKGLVNEREKARDVKDFQKADELRNQIEKLGYSLEDTPGGILIRKL